MDNLERFDELLQEFGFTREAGHTISKYMLLSYTNSNMPGLIIVYHNMDGTCRYSLVSVNSGNQTTLYETDMMATFGEFLRSYWKQLTTEKEKVFICGVLHILL